MFINLSTGALKGLDPTVVDQSIVSLLTDLELVEKCDQLSKTLTGGQKRKLSVAMLLLLEAPRLSN